MRQVQALSGSATIFRSAHPSACSAPAPVICASALPMIWRSGDCARPSPSRHWRRILVFAGPQARIANRDALRAALEAVLAAHSATEWVDKAQHSGVPCGVINTIAQAVEAPQTAARNMILRVGAARVPRNPVKMSPLPDLPERRRAPAIDADGPPIRRELATSGGGEG